MSEVKEPAFFNRDKSYDRGLEWYANTFFSGASGQRYRGESTPWYLYSDAAAERISADCTGVRLLVILRDPVARAWSHYQDQVSAQIEVRSFSQAIFEESADRSNEDPRGIRQQYLTAGDYTLHLTRWLTRFEPDQLLVVTSESMMERPGETWEDVGKHIGMEGAGSVLGDLSRTRENTSGDPRSAKLAALLHAPGRFGRLRGAARGLVPERTYRPVAQWMSDWNKKGNGSAPLPDHLRLALRDHYRPSIGALERVLERSFPEWQ